MGQRLGSAVPLDSCPADYPADAVVDAARPTISISELGQLRERKCRADASSVQMSHVVCGGQPVALTEDGWLHVAMLCTQ
jgi:hypothetical protein